MLGHSLWSSYRREFYSQVLLLISLSIAIVSVGIVHMYCRLIDSLASRHALTHSLYKTKKSVFPTSLSQTKSPKYAYRQSHRQRQSHPWCETKPWDCLSSIVETKHQGKKSNGIISSKTIHTRKAQDSNIISQCQDLCRRRWIKSRAAPLTHVENRLVSRLLEWPREEMRRQLPQRPLDGARG